MDHLAVILLGSNLGDRERNLNEAAELIGKMALHVDRVSKTYSSNAWGKTDQPDFLNRVMGIKTNLIPSGLLKKLLETEQLLKRIRTEKWGPRIIDLDILFFDDLVYSDAALQIPHPGISSRRFTLIPLCEIYPDYIHPVYGIQVSRMLEKCEDRGIVEIYEKHP